MRVKQSILSAVVLVSLLALSSLVSLKLSFEIPEMTNTMMFETCNAVNFYKPATDIPRQDKILINACHKAITREPIMIYLEKREKSPP